MNIQSVISHCALTLLLGFQPTVYAEIYLNASYLNDSMSQNKGIQLHLLNEGLADSLNWDADLETHTQSLKQADYDFRPASIDRLQLAAIYDNFINTKLINAPSLYLVVNTNLQTSKHSQKHVANLNLGVEDDRESTSSTVAIMVDDD